MSIRVMSLVWSKAPVEGSELLLLQALADTADDLGTSYPGIPYLAVKRGCRSAPCNAACAVWPVAGLLKIHPKCGTERDQQIQDRCRQASTRFPT